MAKEYNPEGVDDEIGGGNGPSSGPDNQPTDSREETAANGGNQTTSQDEQTATTQSANESRGESDELPHRVRHDSPKDDRKALTMWVGDEDRARIRNRKDLAERRFDERVYDIDVHLAVFRSEGTEESFLEEMRNIGYGYFD